MGQYLCRADYEHQTAETRDKRMDWWRKARFGMFVHYGLYAHYGRNEWVQALENIPVAEYEKTADVFQPRPGCPREWARLAAEAGMKYMVLTTKHHEGFCLWDTQMTDYNAVRRGPKRDIVAEYVEACREFGLRVGFYYSLMDWHHPDGWRCMVDSEAAERFRQFTRGCVRELMSNYGQVDILWYDVSRPCESYDAWGSLETNQMAREFQPGLIINNRSQLPEDFGTPEGRVTPQDRDWEACMTFNGLSCGYIPADQAAPDSYNVRGILKMLHIARAGAGNLLLNIGPEPDGSVPTEAVAPLQDVGKWLKTYGPAVYGPAERGQPQCCGWADATVSGKTVHLWTKIWPEGPAGIGGFQTKLESARLLATGQELAFEQGNQRIVFTDLPAESPDPIANRTIIELAFEDKPVHLGRGSLYPQLHGGHQF
ncbi:MAG: alpha-L-fucosidase [Planctomycetota bacterium]